jgi:hypothetical protein
VKVYYSLNKLSSLKISGDLSSEEANIFVEKMKRKKHGFPLTLIFDCPFEDYIPIRIIHFEKEE